MAAAANIKRSPPRADGMEETLALQTRVCMFVASFAPLWFMVIGSYLYDAHFLGPESSAPSRVDAVIGSFIAAVLILACIMVTCNAVSRLRESRNMETVVPERVRDVTHANAPSVMVYVVFVVVGAASSHNLFVLAMLSAFVCAVFSRTNMMLTNPSFMLVGFRTYKMEVGSPDRVITLVAKSVPQNGKEVRIKEAAEGVFLDQARHSGGGRAP